MVKIKVIIPNAGMDKQTLKSREDMLKKEAICNNTKINVECIDSGPESIETYYDEYLAAADMLKKIKKAQKNGFDAVIIYCFSDLALDAAREVTEIPIIGPAQISFALAIMLGRRFSVLITLPESKASVADLLKKYEIDFKSVSSIRPIDIPVSELRKNMKFTIKRLEEIGKVCLEKDNAEVLVLGCLGTTGMGKTLQERLNVPVIDPAFVSLNFAEMLVKRKITHSKKSYPNPLNKKYL
jgi:allantoin racemase